MCSPEILATAVTPSRIIAGFVQVRVMVYSESLQWPDMLSMIGTCRGKLKQEDFEMIETHLSALYNTHLEHVQNQEELFDELRFAEDLDGIGVMKPSEETGATCRSRAVLSISGAGKDSSQKNRRRKRKKRS